MKKIRKSISMIIFKIDKSLGKKNHFFVLCYHGFSENESEFDVAVEEFENHIKTYRGLGYSFIDYQTFVKYLRLNKTPRKPSILLTIDDGLKSVIRVRELAKKYKIKPVLFVLADPKNVSKAEGSRKYLSQSEIKELKRDGWAIGSHGLVHSNGRKLAIKEVIVDMAMSKKRLEKELGVIIDAYAYPYGAYIKSHQDLAEKVGYTVAFSMDDGEINFSRRFVIPRIGVNQTHDRAEITYIATPTLVFLRGFLKKHILHL